MRLPDEPELPLQINIVPLIGVSHGQVITVMDTLHQVRWGKVSDRAARGDEHIASKN